MKSLEQILYIASKLPDAAAGEFVKAMYAFIKDGQQPDPDSRVYDLFILMTDKFAQEKELSRKRSESAKKRWESGSRLHNVVMQSMQNDDLHNLQCKRMQKSNLHSFAMQNDIEEDTENRSQVSDIEELKNTDVKENFSSMQNDDLHNLQCKMENKESSPLPPITPITPKEPLNKERSTLCVDTKKENPQRFAAPEFIKGLVEIGVSREIAQDWMKCREKKKLASTKTALEGTIKELSLIKDKTPDELIRFAVENGWGGFRARYYLNVTQHRAQSGKASAQTLDVNTRYNTDEYEF